MALCSAAATIRDIHIRKVIHRSILCLVLLLPVRTFGFVGQHWRRNDAPKLAHSWSLQSIIYHLEDGDEPENGYPELDTGVVLIGGILRLDQASALSIAAVFTSAVLLLSVTSPALAIDHPIDQSILGVPIPVPDVRYFISGGLCAAASHGITTPVSGAIGSFDVGVSLFPQLSLFVLDGCHQDTHASGASQI